MNLSYSSMNSSISFTKYLSLLILVLSLNGCATVKQLAVENDAERLLKQSTVFSNQFTGFSLFDIETNSFVAGYNSTLKFTPASNTKLLTMYAVLETFGDSIPSIIFQEEDSSILIQPIGDPTFLYEPFSYQNSFQFLKNYSSVEIAWPDEELTPFGPGWAWDDYVYKFQAQRSWWPIYGNTVNIEKINDTLSITPPFFEDYVEVLTQTESGETADRALNYNVFKAYLESDTSYSERIIPFEYSKELLIQLLTDTLNRNVKLTSEILSNPDTLYGQSSDSVLARMLKPSDNFLAEQLLLMTAKSNGYNEIKPYIEQLKNSSLISLTDMVWVDGSGLSRYNLISPVDQVRLLKICLNKYGWERMTRILPTGGEGTLEDLYIPSEDEIAFIFAKTGTLSNNHNLSGYLITRSGKRMIFSFMNNHYVRPTEEIKKAMEQFLLSLRNAY